MLMSMRKAGSEKEFPQQHSFTSPLYSPTSFLISHFKSLIGTPVFKKGRSWVAVSPAARGRIGLTTLFLFCLQ